jgi:hypothetical protein
MNRSEICSKIEVITISIDMSIDKRSSSLSPLFFSAFSCLFVFVFFFPHFLPCHILLSRRDWNRRHLIPHTRAIIKSYFRNCSPTFSRTKGKEEDDRQEKKSALAGWLLLVSFALISCYSYYISIWRRRPTPPADNKKRIKQERERARDKDLDKYWGRNWTANSNSSSRALLFSGPLSTQTLHTTVKCVCVCVCLKG